ncbi:unnamed protein product [Adineta steineri]|uniref:Uncharacterized protein n=1 Tax=Adineta steineri TaxID=433720 RepID=A0A814SXC2_9BILA|nr:unnamed protein product [Adineta steineri]CAF1153097.1 unnamed protein product [Adineta steineri]
MNIISEGISTVLGKMNDINLSNKWTILATTLTSAYNTTMTNGAYIVALGKICTETTCFLNNKLEQLEEKAKECQNTTESTSINTNENDLNKLIEQTTEQWTESLETKIDTDIRTKLDESVLNKCTNKLLRKNGKTAQKYHQRHKDNLLWKKFQENKKQYEQHKENLNTKRILNEITNKYNKKLLIIMTKTKDPNLVASIIEEGRPMDMICIHATTYISGRPIKINNVGGTTIPHLICPDSWNKNNIHDKDCILIDFIHSDGKNTFGHFLSSEKIDKNSMNNNDNNCLIHAIMGTKDDNIS